METLVVNLNQDIQVKLNDKGYNVWLKDTNHYLPPSYNKATLEQLKTKADKDGYVTFQLWEFMQIFGATFHNGSDQVCELNIKLVTRE